MSDSSFYDIIVIGAGPAGSTFARVAAAKTKIRILVLDGSTDNGKPCGGLLSPDAQEILARCDLTLPSDVLADPQIFAVKTIDLGTETVRYYPRMYINMDRKKFDNWLISLIPNSVEVIKASCGEIKKSSDDLYEITLRKTGETFRCRYIVGADGANSIVRRKFFKCDIKEYTAIQQWFDSEDITNGQVSPFYSCVFDKETSESCSWSINKDRYFIYGGAFTPHKCREMYEKQKKKFFGFSGLKETKAVRTEACIVFRPRKASDFCTGNDSVFLIGEAAGFISPSSFEGISNAMSSGISLAESFCTDNIRKAYRKKTAKLRRKLLLKCVKRVFMYNPFLRNCVMRSGITSVSLYK